MALIAIENAWLYEQVKAGHEHLQVLSRQLLEVQEASAGAWLASSTTSSASC